MNIGWFLLAWLVMGGITFLSHFTAGLAWQVLVNQAFPLLVLGVWLVLRLVQGASWPTTRLGLPLAVWMAVCLASSLLAVMDPRLALEGWVTGVLWPTLGFFLLVDFVQRGWEGTLWRALYGVAFVVGLLNLWELAAWYFGGPLPGGSGLSWWDIGGMADPLPPTLYRLRFGLVGAAASPYLASYWALLIPPLLGAALDEKRKATRITLLVGALAGTILMLLTFSRSGLLALAVAMGVFGVLIALKTRSHWWAAIQRHRFRLVLVLAVLAGVVVLVVLLSRYFFGGGHVSGDVVRLALWRRAVDLFLSRPWLGIGWHNFSHLGWIGLPGALKRPGSGVHNQALSILAETGLLGGMVWLWMLGVALVIGFRRWSQLSRSGRQMGRWIGAAAGLVGFAAASFTADLTWWPLAVPFSFLAAWTLRMDSPDQGRRRVRWPWLVALGLLAVSALGLARADLALADYQRALKFARTENWAEAAVWADKAAGRDPGIVLYSLQAAQFWAQAAVEPDGRVNETMLIRSSAGYQRALRPDVNPLHRENAAWVEWMLGNQGEALALASLAADQAPEGPPIGPAVWLGTGALYEAAGAEESALEAYSRALALCPGLLTSPYWEATSWRQNHQAQLQERMLNELRSQPNAALIVPLLGTQQTVDLLPEVAAAWLADRPESPAGWEVLGLNYLARGQIEQAYLAGDQLCRLSPSSPGCFLVRGWVAAERGDYGTALHDLQAVVFAAPGTSRAAAASWRLAEYNRNLGQEQQAWLWMQRATPPPPGFDTGEKYGCLPVIVPLDWWPAVRPLPVGGLAWQTALKWAEEDGLQEVANQLCEVGLEYDAAFDLCRQ